MPITTSVARAARATATLALLASLGALAACDARQDPIAAASLLGPDSTAIDSTASTGAGTGVITLPAGTTDVLVGATLQLSATGDPALFPVTWSSDTPGVATVSALGVVTGVAPGTARITARSTVNPLRAASTLVRVTTAP